MEQSQPEEEGHQQEADADADEWEDAKAWKAWNRVSPKKRATNRRRMPMRMSGRTQRLRRRRKMGPTHRNTRLPTIVAPLGVTGGTAHLSRRVLSAGGFTDR